MESFATLSTERHGFPAKDSMVATGLRLARGYAVETRDNRKAIGLACSTACIPVKRERNGDGNGWPRIHHERPGYPDPWLLADNRRLQRRQADVCHLGCAIKSVQHLINASALSDARSRGGVNSPAKAGESTESRHIKHSAIL
jgi:hypothetical protein